MAIPGNVKNGDKYIQKLAATKREKNSIHRKLNLLH